MTRPRPSSRCYDSGCQWWSPLVGDAGMRAWQQHHRTEHNPVVTERVVQLSGVTWQEQFVAAITAIPVGVEFTTADLHGRIPDPPHPNHWGAATTVAATLGLCKPVDVQKSTLDTSKGSRLLRWVRTVQSSRGAA